MLPAATQRLPIAAFALVCLSETLAAAQDTSAWDKELHAAARLIAGSIIEIDDTTLLRAGIEIRLDPGWHTYWRDPGDSGVPPTFDFGGSENVKSVTVLWPTPERFPDGAGGHFIGYKGNVIFPLRIVPKEAATGSSIHLKLAYAVCEKLCIPADANLKLALPGMSSANERVLIAAETRVPRSVPLGAGNSLAIRSVRREGDDGHGRVVVDVAAPDGVPVDLFAEGPTPEWSLPLPKLIGSEPGTRRFVFELQGLPPGAYPTDAMLTFTVVLPGDAIEVVTHIE
jgi:DsbC/DsbD-like thiol-disulfide interchange protein